MTLIIYIVCEPNRFALPVWQYNRYYETGDTVFVKVDLGFWSERNRKRTFNNDVFEMVLQSGFMHIGNVSEWTTNHW